MRSWERNLPSALLSVAFFFGVAITPAWATDAGKLLPADTKVIVTLNLRRILSDHRGTPFVQRYLDQWRLALKDDQQQLKNYYRVQDLHESEGISEKEFLARAKIIKTVSDALGIDPLEDLDQITFTSSDVVVIEGRFKQEQFKPAIQKIGKDYFGSCKLVPPDDVWQIPATREGSFVSLVDAKTLAITGSRRAMDDLLALAADKQREGLAKGMRTLLDGAHKEHVGIVLADVDRILDDLARFLKGEVAKSVKADDAVSKFIVTLGADALEKYAKDISAVGVGLSFREDDVRVQLGLDAKTPTFAKDLRGQIQQGNFWGALALKASNNNLAQGLASILIRQRVTLKETTLITHTEVPYDFVKLAAKGPWLVLLSKDFALAGAPEPNAALAQTALDAVSTRITNIPLWTLPARDKTKSLPAGTFDVLEVRDVAYKSERADAIRHRLDMYLPKDKKDFPVLVLVHGGAWFMGDNRSCGLYPSVGQFLASQGIGVVMPNYRLFPAVKHPEHAKDVARAVAWTHANIHKHGGDPRRLYLAGHSAGGHLVALLAADESYLRGEEMKPADIKGVIAMSGVYRIPPGEKRFSLGGDGPRAFWSDHMWPLRGDSSASFKQWIPGLPIHLNLFAPIFGDTPRECALASPVSHVHKGMPPLLLMVAERDLPTLPEMADEFQQALVKNGCEVRLLKLAKRNHNSLMFSAIRPDDPAARAMLEFIRK